MQGRDGRVPEAHRPASLDYTALTLSRWKVKTDAQGYSLSSTGTSWQVAGVVMGVLVTSSLIVMKQRHIEDNGKPSEQPTETNKTFLTSLAKQENGRLKEPRLQGAVTECEKTLHCGPVGARCRRSSEKQVLRAYRSLPKYFEPKEIFSHFLG